MYTLPGIPSDLLDNEIVNSREIRTIDFETLVAQGKVKWARPINAYGARITIGAETNFPVWANGAFTLPPTAGVQMSIVSTSADDTLGGTGINSVEMHYLDKDLDEKRETINLSGLTPVLSVATDVRFIEEFHLETIGAGIVAAGRITASNSGIVYQEIPAGDVRGASAFRMVPRGKRLFVTAAFGSSTSGTAAARTSLSLVSNKLDVRIHTDPLVLIPLATIGLQDNAVQFQFPGVEPLPEGAVIGARHTSDKACNIAISWFGRLEDV